MVLWRRCQVVAAMVESGKSLRELKQKMTKLPQRMINVACPATVLSAPAVLAGVKHIETRLQGRGRVLLRASGTEPLVRVMIEGEDLALVDGLAEELAGIVATAGAT